MNFFYTLKQVGVVTNVLVCDIIGIEFELQSRYYVHFRANNLGESFEPKNPANYKLDITTTVLL